MLTLLSLLLVNPGFAAAASISDLPELSKRIVHHYDCSLILFHGQNSESQEKTFTIDPAKGGQTGDSFTAFLGTDALKGSANSQMLNLDWTRDGKLIATAQTMIQQSDTKAYVLIVGDPSDESNQGSLSCSAVTYDSLGGK